MTVSGNLKLKALEKAFSSKPGTVAVETSSSPAMRSAAGKPQAIEPDFSGVRRATAFYHSKVNAGERTVLTAGVEAANIKS